MLKELSTSLKAQLYERLSSPILGSLLIFWLLFNWEAVAYFFLSESNVEVKLAHISENYSNACINVYYPAVSATLFCVLYPLISFIPFHIWEWTSFKKLTSKSKYSLNEPLSVEKALAIRQELLSKNRELKKVISDFQDQRKELEDTLESVNRDNRRLYHIFAEHSAIHPQDVVILDDEENGVLSHFYGIDADHFLVPSDVAQQSRATTEHILKVIDSLVHKGMLEEAPEGFKGEDGYELTSAGKKYLDFKYKSEDKEEAER